MAGVFRGGGEQMLHELRWVQRRVCERLQTDKEELRKERAACAVCAACTYKAVGVLGARAAAGALAVAAVADVRPEAATVTLLRAHRLRHCPGSGETGRKSVTYVCEQIQM